MSDTYTVVLDKVAGWVFELCEPVNGPLPDEDTDVFIEWKSDSRPRSGRLVHRDGKLFVETGKLGC